MSKKGWFKEPARHSLAAMGVKSPKKSIMVKRIKYKKVVPKVVRQWKCDNCGAWVDDDGSGNDHEGYTCSHCDSCMYPEELARFYADGDLKAKMIWRDDKTPSKAWAGPLRTDSNSVYMRCIRQGMSDAEAREYVLRNAPNEMRAEFPEQIPLEPASLGRGGKLVPSKSVKATKTTHNGFYYKFPKERFYIIRWLKDGGYHLYPQADGKLPKGYPSREAAKRDYRNIDGTEFKLVTGSEASKYPVPKRW